MDSLRTAEIARKTNETDIRLKLDLDGGGKPLIDTGVGFLNHMLTLFASHGRFSLAVTCKGDVDVDDHHSVEDVGIALGQAFSKALGEKRGIRRYGSCILPMDEALILAAVDFSGRTHLTFDAELPAQKVGSFDTELVREFWLAFVRNADCSLHLREIAGDNTHHIIEGMFKAAARAIRTATELDPALKGELPSTKGVL
jgi:imidazoleglycerol-phosphate dehydratase